MKNLLRVIAMALRYRAMVAMAIGSSLLVGILWGANIGTAYPVMKVVFYGESIPTSIARRLKESRERQRELTRQIEQRKASEPPESGGDGPDDRGASGKSSESGENGLPSAPVAAAAATVELPELQRRLDQSRAEERRYLKWQPFADRWLPRTPLATMGIVVLMLFTCTLLRSIALATQEMVVATVSQRTVFDLRNKLYRRSLFTDVAKLDDERASRLISHFTHDIPRLGDAVVDAFGPLLREPLKIVACLVGAACVSWRLLLVTLVVAPLSGFIIRGATAAMRKASAGSMDSMGEFQAQLSQSFDGIRVIRAFGIERGERSRFREINKSILDRSIAMAWIRAWIKPTSEVLAFFMVAIALMAGTHLVISQSTLLFGMRITDSPMPPEALMMFFGFMVGLSDPVNRLSGMSTRLTRCGVAADRYFRLLERPDNVAEPEVRTPPRRGNDIELDGVCFAYHEDTPVLQKVSFTIPAGQCTAIVGPNGSGKSTLIDLLARFYDPAAGAIRLGGVDLREFRRRDLRRQTALVTQHTKLFDDTVRNNIRRVAAGATDAQVEEAARAANAHQMILEELADGYDTIVGEGSAFLSGGQAQRIALARAILRDPPVLLLDEPTSSVDADAEKCLVETLTRFTQGRTTVLVSHRPELLRLASQIVVMESGMVSDCGPAADVLARSKFVQSIWGHSPPAAPATPSSPQRAA